MNGIIKSFGEDRILTIFAFLLATLLSLDSSLEDCAWYEVNDPNGCALNGNVVGIRNVTASEACCVCGGDLIVSLFCALLARSLGLGWKP